MLQSKSNYALDDPYCAAVGDFSLSSSDTTELEEAVLSLSESKVSLSDTELSGLLVLAPLVLAAISARAKGQLCP